jgi:hypothetical protein
VLATGTSTISAWGAVCFGAFVGIIVYRSLIRMERKPRLADIGTMIAAVAGGAITTLFPSQSDLFGYYAIGLIPGMGIYFLTFLALNGRKKTSHLMGNTSCPSETKPGGPQA